VHLAAGDAIFFDWPVAFAFNAPTNFVGSVPGTRGTRSIPEPGTAALLASGLVLLGVSIGRRPR